MRRRSELEVKWSKFKVVAPTVFYRSKPHGPRLTNKIAKKGKVIIGQAVGAGWIRTHDRFYLPIVEFGRRYLEAYNHGSPRDVEVEEKFQSDTDEDSKLTDMLTTSARSTSSRRYRSTRQTRHINSHFRKSSRDFKSMGTQNLKDNQAIMEKLLHATFGTPSSHMRVTWDTEQKGSHIVLTDGNLSAHSFASHHGVLANKSLVTGIYSWEVRWETMGDMKGKMCVGVSTRQAWNPEVQLGQNQDTWAYHCNGWASHAGRRSNYGEVCSEGDVIGIEIDMDSGTVHCYKNRVAGGRPYKLPVSMLQNKPLYPAVTLGRGDKVTIRNFMRKPLGRKFVSRRRKKTLSPKPRSRPDIRRRWVNPYNTSDGLSELHHESEMHFESSAQYMLESDHESSGNTTSEDGGSLTSGVGPPGDSKAEAKDSTMMIRQSWNKGDEVEVFSFSKQQWMKAIIHRTFIEAGRKWVEARFNDGLLKKDVAVEDVDAIRPRPKQSPAEPEVPAKPEYELRPEQLEKVKEHIRLKWKVGDDVLVYSNSLQNWFNGKIMEVFTDSQGEWLRVQYNKFSKDIHREDLDSIRPTEEAIDAWTKTLFGKPEVKLEPIPPPVLDDSIVDDDKLFREGWQEKDHVQVYSVGEQAWQNGKINTIKNDHEGEWLVVFYEKKTGLTHKKDVKRHAKAHIRPVKLYVKSLGRSVCIQLNHKGLTTTVGLLKDLISEQDIGFQVDRQRLRYQAEPESEAKISPVIAEEGPEGRTRENNSYIRLDDDDNTLSTLSIPNGATVELIRLGLVVFIKIKDGNCVEIPLPFGLDSSLSAVKAKLSQKIKLSKRYIKLAFNDNPLEDDKRTLRSYGVRLESVLVANVKGKDKKKKKKDRLQIPRSDRVVDYFYVLGLRRNSMESRKRELKRRGSAEIEMILPIVDLLFSTNKNPPTKFHRPVPNLCRRAQAKHGDGWIGSGYLFYSTSTESANAGPICQLRVVSKETKTSGKLERMLILGKNSSHIIYSRNKNEKPIIEIIIIRKGDSAPGGFTRLEASLQKSGYLSHKYSICIRKGDEQCQHYDPELLDQYPTQLYSDYPSDFSHKAFATYCFPNGVQLTQYRPLSLFFFQNFKFTLGAEGRVFYGSALTIFEEFGRANELDMNAPLPPLQDLALQNHETPSEKVYCPKCLVLISQDPQYQGMKDFLTQLYNVAMTPIEKQIAPIEAYVWQFFNSMPRPIPGLLISEYNFGGARGLRFDFPPPVYFPDDKVPLGALFRCLEPKKVVRVYELILNEAQILFISSDITTLYDVSLAFKCLLFPFGWELAWIPILPIEAREQLLNPSPFVIGVQRSFFNQFRLPEDEKKKFEIIDLDNNVIQEHTNLNPVDNSDNPHIPCGAGPRKPELPAHIGKGQEDGNIPLLEELLCLKKLKAKPHSRADSFYSASDYEQQELNNAATDIARIEFLRANIQILWRYQEFYLPNSSIQEKPIDSMAMVRSKPRDQQGFYRQFVETQLFMSFTSWRSSPDFSGRFGASKRFLNLLFFDYCMAVCTLTGDPPQGMRSAIRPKKAKSDIGSFRSSMKGSFRSTGLGTSVEAFGAELTSIKIEEFRNQCRHPPVKVVRGKEIEESEQKWADSKWTDIKKPELTTLADISFPKLNTELLVRCAGILPKDRKRPPHPMEGNRFYAIDPHGLDHWMLAMRQNISQDTNLSLQTVSQLAQQCFHRLRFTNRNRMISSVLCIYDLWFHSYLISAAQRIRWRVWMYRNDPDCDEKIIMEVQKVLFVALGVAVRMADEDLLLQIESLKSLALFCAYCQAPHELQMVIRLAAMAIPSLPPQFYEEVAAMLSNSRLHLNKKTPPKTQRSDTKAPANGSEDREDREPPSALPLWMRVVARCEGCGYTFSGEDIVATYVQNEKELPSSGVECLACGAEGIKPTLLAKTKRYRPPEGHPVMNPQILHQVFMAICQQKRGGSGSGSPGSWSVVDEWESDPLHEFRHEPSFRWQFWNIFWCFTTCSLPYGFLLSEREEYLVQLDPSRQYIVRCPFFQPWSISLPGVDMEFDRFVGDDAQQLGASLANEVPRDAKNHEVRKIAQYVCDRSKSMEDAPPLLPALIMYIRERQRHAEGGWSRTPEWFPEALFYSQSMLHALYPVAEVLQISQNYLDQYTTAYNFLIQCVTNGKKLAKIMDTPPSAQHSQYCEIIRSAYAAHTKAKKSQWSALLKVTMSKIYSSNLKFVSGMFSPVSPPWPHLYSDSTLSQNRWCPNVSPGSVVVSLDLDIDYARFVAPAIDDFSRMLVGDMWQLVPPDHDQLFMRVLNIEPNTLVEIAVEPKLVRSSLPTGFSDMATNRSQKTKTNSMTTWEVARQIATNRLIGSDSKDCRSPKGVQSVSKEVEDLQVTMQLRQIDKHPVKYRKDDDIEEDEESEDDAGRILMELAELEDDTIVPTIDGENRDSLLCAILGFKVLVLLEKQGMINCRNYTSEPLHPRYGFDDVWEYERAGEDGKWTKVNVKYDDVRTSRNKTSLVVQDLKLSPGFEYTGNWADSSIYSKDGWLYATNFHQNFHAGKRSGDRARKKMKYRMVGIKEYKAQGENMTVYERQRFYNSTGWSSKLLPEEGYSWSTGKDGKVSCLLGSCFCVAPTGMRFAHEAKWKLVTDPQEQPDEMGWFRVERGLRLRRWQCVILPAKPGEPLDKKLLPCGKTVGTELNPPSERWPYVTVESVLDREKRVSISPISEAEYNAFVGVKFWRHEQKSRLNLALATRTEVYIQDVSIEEIKGLVELGHRLQISSRQGDNPKKQAALRDQLKKFSTSCTSFVYSPQAQHRLVSSARVLVQEHLTDLARKAFVRGGERRQSSKHHGGR